MKIKVKYHAKIQPLKFIEQGDWIDCRCATSVKVKPGEFGLIPLGFSLELPEGYEAHLVPRSSTFKNWGLLQTNSIGIIDESYNGDGDQWYFPFFASRKVIIKPNERICQFRIVKKQPKFEFEVVESLGNDDRGGIGSTGKE